MNTPTRSIHAAVGLAALILVAAPAIQAFATISNPATDQRVLLGTDVAAPVPGVRIEADTKSKESLIRVAPYHTGGGGSCGSCFFDGG